MITDQAFDDDKIRGQRARHRTLRQSIPPHLEPKLARSRREAGITLSIPHRATDPVLRDRVDELLRDAAMGAALDDLVQHTAIDSARRAVPDGRNRHRKITRAALETKPFEEPEHFTPWLLHLVEMLDLAEAAATQLPAPTDI